MRVLDRSMAVVCLSLLVAQPALAGTAGNGAPPSAANPELEPAAAVAAHRSPLVGPVALRAYVAKRYPDEGLKDELTPLGRRARGFYITAPYLYRVGAERVAASMTAAHVNAVVVDLKDDWGTVAWRSAVPLSRHVQTPLFDVAKLAQTFHAHGLYFIARLVAFKDSRLPRLRRDLAVRLAAEPEHLLSASRRGALWLDVYAAEAQDYLIDLARELASLGVDEIQFDYLRFPPGRSVGRWLHADQRDHATVITQFLERVDRALQLPISVDIFGLTTLVRGDPRRIGQSVELLARYAEAISPMMYANGMHSYFAGQRVTEEVYALIHCGLWSARQRVPQVVLRPFLQAYPNGVRSFWSPAFIARQLDAAERAGANGFLLWNASMKNDVAYGSLRQLGAERLARFGADEALHLRPENRPRGFFCREQP
ncbi:MAG: hypothetical protein IPG96_18985 [Proteobacteria bacterium]|nr:hypothetical protein [Pseudomonadota bacterium]